MKVRVLTCASQPKGLRLKECQETENTHLFECSKSFVEISEPSLRPYGQGITGCFLNFFDLVQSDVCFIQVPTSTTVGHPPAQIILKIHTAKESNVHIELFSSAALVREGEMPAEFSVELSLHLAGIYS